MVLSFVMTSFCHAHGFQGRVEVRTPGKISKMTHDDSPQG